MRAATKKPNDDDDDEDEKEGIVVVALAKLPQMGRTSCMKSTGNAVGFLVAICCCCCCCCFLWNS